jgi:hypothetical protein
MMMMTTAGVVTIGGVATTVAGTVAGDILAVAGDILAVAGDILAVAGDILAVAGGILAGGTVGGTTNPRVLTFARVCQRRDVSLVPYSWHLALAWHDGHPKARRQPKSR